ncbi:hypothetical protein Tco_1561235 [Tanacetum coccineum]
MLEKDLYDSWKSRMELCMQNREHGRMILESVEHGLLIWPTIEENEMTRTKKYAELSPTEKIQADCDMKYNTSCFRKQDRTQEPSQNLHKRSSMPLDLILAFPHPDKLQPFS